MIVVSMSEEERKFKKEVDETLRSIYSKINEEEKIFLCYVVNRFNEICERNFNAIEYIGSREMYNDDFDTETNKLLDLLKGDKE